MPKTQKFYTVKVTVRLDEHTLKNLESLVKLTNETKAQLVRRGINALYLEVTDI